MFLISLVYVLVAGADAMACSVCGFGKEESRVAFIVTTAILTVVPLCLISGAAYYLFRRSKQAESGEP